MDTYVDNSKLGGKGTFAKIPIKKGQHLTILSGETITTNQAIERIEKGQENKDDLLQIDEGLYIDLDEPPRLINHSCNPNAGIRGKNELFAIKDIRSGEEITYDYSTVVGTNIPPEIWTMKCICNESNCRKIVGNVLSIPKDQLLEYQRLDALPDFILKQLSSV